MKIDAIKKLIPPLGPIFSLILIGMLLLSAILYYRAVKIQRFLEPALAISEPRMRFTQSLRNLLTNELDAEEMNHIRFRTSSITVDQSLLLASAHAQGPGEPLLLKKLSRVFLLALRDPLIRDNISLILVNSRFPFNEDPLKNKEMRFQTQERSVLILNSLLTLEPELEKDYARYFSSSALPSNAPPEELSLVEFRIVPTERLHIEVLRRLEQYAY